MNLSRASTYKAVRKYFKINPIYMNRYNNNRNNERTSFYILFTLHMQFVNSEAQCSIESLCVQLNALVHDMCNCDNRS